MFQYTRRIFNDLKGKRTYLSRENIPTISLIIGSCALFFQTMILFPWHQVLSKQFDSMERNVKKMEDLTVKLNQQMNELLQLEEQIKRKNNIVLESSQRILSELEETEEEIHTIKKEYIEE